MTYDNTKFEAAFTAWLDANVDIGFGEHYAGDLLDDLRQLRSGSDQHLSGPQVTSQRMADARGPRGSCPPAGRGRC